MSKRRYNAKKIANTPQLKKRMAKFCATVDVSFQDTKVDIAEILYKGHRGFISLSEDDLAKEFDKRLEFMRDKYGAAVKEDQDNQKGRWYRKSDHFANIELWYEEGANIANEIFEEQFLK